MPRSVPVRGSRRARSHSRRLYRGRGTRARELEAFEQEYPSYPKARVERIYGATVGKVKREREAKRRRQP